VNYRTLDPASGRLVESYPATRDADVAEALDRTQAASTCWRDVALEDRARRVRLVGEALEAQSESLARLMALEMGKPLAEGEAEARKCAWACRHFADRAAEYLEPRPRESDGASAAVRYEALGPILAIMPWNFPLWQFFRFAAPALLVGNVILLKHAPNTPACALRIESLLRDSGFPHDAVQNLFLSNEQVARAIADRRVRGVTFTGSTQGGRQVAAVAGSHLKTMVMELGGSDPFLVFADADIDRAVEQGVAARCLNNGQSCIAAKRFLIERGVFERFREEFVERMRSRVLGNPADRAVELGPLAREDLREKLADQVAASVAAGARALCGATVPERDGFFYPATVLDDIPPGAPAARQELFGPVAALWEFASEEEAVALANDSDYGLGASLWTGDADRAARIGPRLEAGSVFVNGIVKSDPRLPFGGIKDSGFGRELGREGMLEFTNRKTVWTA